MKTFVEDADGVLWEYRLVSSRLERRRRTAPQWSEVYPHDWPTMTANELRHIAEVIDSPRRKEPSDV